ncbi:TraB/GumN family protein [uncultured Tateyamaria sp.]|uniref:TraB/GumN family protein n=1 Tax=uncultured Tateyamaria sp. TaxID=455651 RepID=UPI00260D9E92|nr:TraB/GumN family protein [uncultured Tateyamaria sp.]
MVRQLLLALSFMAPLAAHAACTGTDLRPTLDDTAQNEIASISTNMPFSEGNHWRAVRDNQVINLVGTMHIFDARMEAIVDRLEPVVETADLLMVEITAKEEAALLNAIATDPSIAFLSNGPSLIDLVSPETWTVLSEAAQARGVPPFMAAKYQPWFLSLTLGIAPCAMADLHAGKVGLDKMVMARATAADVPIVELETHQDLIALLGSEPIEEQVRFLPMIAQMEQFIVDSTATTVESYFDEKHGELLAFSRVFSRGQVDLPDGEFDVLFDDMMEELLVQRNLAWMDRIDARTEANIVIAVGAAHLSGESGLLQQLSDRGFELERMPF